MRQLLLTAIRNRSPQGNGTLFGSPTRVKESLREIRYRHFNHVHMEKGPRGSVRFAGCGGLDPLRNALSQLVRRTGIEHRTVDNEIEKVPVVKVEGDPTGGTHRISAIEKRPTAREPASSCHRIRSVRRSTRPKVSGG
jgi:hypothetical protein